MSKHTQGPWIFSDWVHVTNQGDVPTTIKGSGVPYGRAIADLNFSNKDEELSSDKVIANAKLIAAAPDLLEALENIIGDIFEHIHPEDYKKCKAAIKKATE